MSEHADADLADALEDRDAAETTVRWINRQYDNEETNRDYRSAIRVFGKRVLPRAEPPESLDWVPTGTSRSYDPVPNQSDLVRWEPDVLTMLDHAMNARDRSAIAVQFEAGLRPFEFTDLAIGNVFDAEHSVGLHVDGKTGERAVYLIVAVPYFLDWLDDHPAPDEDAPVWCQLDEPVQPSHTQLLKMFEGPARRADVSPPVTPRNFRRSNTRWLILQGMSQTEIEDRQGRKRGSEHTQRYFARFGPESSERRYAQLHGEDVDADPAEEPVGPIKCPRCDRDTPRHESHCMWCHFGLDYDAAKVKAEQTSDLMQSLGDRTDLANAVADLEQAAADVPGLRVTFEYEG